MTSEQCLVLMIEITANDKRKLNLHHDSHLWCVVQFSAFPASVRLCEGGVGDRREFWSDYGA